LVVIDRRTVIIPHLKYNQFSNKVYHKM